MTSTHQMSVVRFPSSHQMMRYGAQ